MTIKHVVFIDSCVSDYQSLTAGLSTDTHWELLDGDSDGVLQMQTALSGYANLDSIQVISHGSTGTLYLGSTVLNAGSLGKYERELESIGGTLSETGDLLLYGCNVAQGDIGLSFVNELAGMTGADVAASKNLTGASVLGADWLLEQTTGVINVPGTSESSFADVLVANTATSSIVGDGMVTTNFDGYDVGLSVTLQSDGKILVAGSTGVSTPYDAFAVARYNSNGSLDTTFDTDGKVTTGFAGRYSGNSVTVQSDGKIVVAGVSAGDFFLTRYNSNGSLDNTFDANGLVRTDFGGNEFCQSVIIQSDGKILVAGKSAGDFALARYLSDGSLDTTFDTDGKVMTSFGLRDDSCFSVTVQSDGKILLGGYSDGDFAVARYNSNGSLDTTFDTDGKVTTDFGDYEYCYSATLQSDGKILLAGMSQGNFVLARYNSNGSLDITFDTDGKVTTDFGGYDNCISITVQSDGKIIAAGSSSDNFAVARYNSNGSLDTTFDTDGKVTTDFGANEYCYSATLQSDGKILVAGSSSDNFAVVRYNSNGSLDTTFSAPDGTQGNDTLVGGSGSPIDGLAGIDTVTYSGNRGSVVNNLNGTWTVGTDTLTNIERLQFADKRVALDITDNALETLQCRRAFKSTQRYALNFTQGL